MSQDEQAELEAIQADTEVQPEVEARDEQSHESESSDNEDSKQLEAELKRERESREKAEKAAADYAFKLREKNRKEEPETEIADDEDTPITAKQLSTLLAKEREATRKEVQSQQIEVIAGKLSTSETEKQYILELHKNRSFPSHLSLEEQLEECHILAVGKRLKGENSELKRALASKGRVSTDASGTHYDAPTGSQPKLAQGEAAEYARVGFIWNGTSRMYEKKLPDGSRLVKDPKTKAIQVIKA